jgi:membrane protein DedA with SNARE-associated domain/rhodanese-related sulfurtransferase
MRRDMFFNADYSAAACAFSASPWRCETIDPSPTMRELLSNISNHEYSILFCIVFAEAIGLPVPAALALLIAGGTGGKDPLRFGLVLLVACFAMVLGDALMYFLGRRTGWWLLGVLCKISLNPESCILRSAESFQRRGRLMLVFSKFVPGINTLSPPLAGTMNMRFAQFFLLDVGGTLLYTLAYCGVGFLFSDYLATLKSGYQGMSRIVIWGFAAAMLIYLGYHLLTIFKEGRLSYVPRVSAASVARHFYSDVEREMVIFDVRSHGYYSSAASRIKGSNRLEPNRLPQQIESLPRDKEMILYCTCRSDATSVRVARILQRHGCRSSVIKGGLRAWKKGGFPLETVPPEDVVLLPTF